MEAGVGGEGGGVGWSKIYIFVPEARKPNLTFLELNEQEGCNLYLMFPFTLTDGLICHLLNEILWFPLHYVIAKAFTREAEKSYSLSWLVQCLLSNYFKM